MYRARHGGSADASGATRMKIALRTSGGRGEYELAGRHGSINHTDLYSRAINYELAPEIIVEAHAKANVRDGKPRIRLDDPRRDLHAQLLLADVLLLPTPIRELRRTGRGLGVLHDGAYAVTGVSVDVVSVGPTALLRPRVIVASNTAHRVE